MSAQLLISKIMEDICDVTYPIVPLGRGLNSRSGLGHSENCFECSARGAGLEGLLEAYEVD